METAIGLPTGVPPIVSIAHAVPGKRQVTLHVTVPKLIHKRDVHRINVPPGSSLSAVQESHSITPVPLEFELLLDESQFSKHLGTVVLDKTGKQLKREDVLQRLKTATPAMIALPFGQMVYATDGMPDRFYLPVLTDDVVIIVPDRYTRQKVRKIYRSTLEAEE